MKRLHIVGRKNHGKTTLLVEILRELRSAGLCVGTIKHTRHVHELDSPGSDSYRHRLGGAAPAAIVSGDAIAVHLPRREQDYFDQIKPLFAGCDLVLVEGDLDGDGHKIEVWREAMGEPCLAGERPDIAAVITDDAATATATILPRSDLQPLLDYLFDFVAKEPREVFS
ncbi:MAG: molybdopterin-guanine dinucleotide biosynthesis protein B [Rhodopirellula sp.]|nr:molybdopterin-guanine dinucleotide biosynthesis protein B [Rhodopirellula sp.]